ncbi:glycosyltransferase family 4 protein [Holdemania massiliensis]|uniref:glycosyltransferase family 4 protein n=1 Tax=Holdemania massiliensis TaxID=1468449 RepID=UPI001F06F11D|nr:glycosyltransferase family 4 protein [Holdemania massiliensis]MCH1940217.1 glycosyltransferase family 4 protein [Holdemania massiliensis]
MEKILWLTNLPAPYRIEFFNQLGKYVELFVIFEGNRSEDRDANWFNYDFKNFESLFLENDYKKNIISIRKVLKSRKFTWAFNTDYSSINGLIFLGLCKLNGVSVILEADGGIPVNRGFIMNKLISGVMLLHSYYFSTGKYTDDYFFYYGVKNEKIWHYRFSSLTEKEINRNRLVSKSERNENFNILSIGQQIYRKGYDILIDAVNKLDIPIVLNIIGGIPSEQLLNRISVKKKGNIHFFQYMDKVDLDRYFRSADLFVLPSREEIWGLVINEAASYNIPVITSDNCIAGKEFCLKNNIGLIFKNEDIQDLVDKIMIMYHDKDARYEFSRNCSEINDKYTIENMVLDHLKFFNFEKSN